MRLILLLIFMALLLGVPAGFAPQAAFAGPSGDDLVQTAGDPDDFTLSAAHPNPFNPQTSFSLTLRERQEVTVEVFNLLGVRVQHLYSGTMEAGETRTFTFTADNLPSGIYLYRVQGESFTATRQMTLLK